MKILKNEECETEYRHWKPQQCCHREGKFKTLWNVRVNILDNPLQAGRDASKRTGCISSCKVKKKWSDNINPSTIYDLVKKTIIQATHFVVAK